MHKNDPRRSRLLEEQPPLPRAFSEAPDADAAHQRALADTRAECQEQAQREMARELEKVHGALADALQGVAEAHDKVIHECRDALVQLALDAASCMLRTRIDAGDPVAARALEQGLAMLPPAPHMRIRTHPEDRQVLEAAVSGTSTAVDFVEDGTISRGGCIVETEHGIVDARVDTAEAELLRVATEGKSQP